jgi:hypothetical protein
MLNPLLRGRRSNGGSWKVRHGDKALERKDLSEKALGRESPGSADPDK